VCKDIRIGVVGLGYWGPNFVRILYTRDDCDFRAACDLNEERVKYVRSLYPDLNYYTDLEEMVKKEKLNALIIATPTDSHYPIAKFALENGIDVLVEKPLAKNSKEARDLIEVAKHNNRILMVGHTFIYNPAVRAVKALIEKGELGRIYYISSIRINLGIYRKDVDVLWDLASHDFSIFLYWLGKTPVKVSALAKDFKIKDKLDVAFIQAVFPDDIIANIHVSWLAPNKVRYLIIVGEKKMIIYDEIDPREKVRIVNAGVDVREPESFGEFQLTYRTGDMYVPRLENVEPLKLEVSDFLNSIKYRKKPLSDGEMGLKVVEILERVQKSILGVHL